MSESLFTTLADALEKQAASDWRSIARPSQLPPPGKWTIWLLMAGRGFGKTFAGAHWVRERVERGIAKRIAIVGATMDDARAVMIEGPSGLLAVSPDWQRPTFEPSKRRLTWPNNAAVATLFSADEPERFRGPEHDTIWGDEPGTWPYHSAFDNMMLGLRVGRNPRCCLTTTPRPTKLIRSLLSREGKDVVVTRGTTYENRENLAPSFFASIVGRYEGTRLGRQEINAELLEDTPGALWQRAKIDELRVSALPARLARIVIAIDPAATSGPEADETGIIVAALGPDRHGFIIEDLSGRYAPHVWARKAIDAYHRHHADRIIGEVNNGGEMIEHTLRMIDATVSYKGIHASRGKVVRAEPVAALYEQGKVHHTGSFPQLEDQMCSFSADADRSRGSSPDRVDALVWALSELMVEGRGPMVITERALELARTPAHLLSMKLRSSSTMQPLARTYTPSELDEINARGVNQPSISYSDRAEQQAPSTRSPAEPGSAKVQGVGQSVSWSDAFERKR